MIKPLLTVSAALEGGTGVLLVLSPSLGARLLFANPLGSATAEVVGRVTGVVLLSLALACWVARLDRASRAARGVVGAMLLYNVAVTILLADAGLALHLAGPILWPVVVLHAGCAIWCATVLLGARRAPQP